MKLKQAKKTMKGYKPYFEMYRKKGYECLHYSVKCRTSDVIISMLMFIIRWLQGETKYVDTDYSRYRK